MERKIQVDCLVSYVEKSFILVTDRKTVLCGSGGVKSGGMEVGFCKGHQSIMGNLEFSMRTLLGTKECWLLSQSIPF